MAESSDPSIEAEWERMQRKRPEPSPASYWDTRAREFVARPAHHTYAADFLRLAALEPGDSVLDMGCGAGTLAVPLALSGHAVVAADFSPEMIRLLTQDAQARGIPLVSVGEVGAAGEGAVVAGRAVSGEAGAGATGGDAAGMPHPGKIAPLLLSWDDDWAAAGITKDLVDVAFSSRSLTTQNYQRSLERLTAVARKKVCLTVAAHCWPQINREAMIQLGLSVTESQETRYLLNLVREMGYEPALQEIVSVRNEAFDSFEEAYDHYSAMIDKTNRDGHLMQVDLDQARGALKGWMQDHLKENAAAPSSNAAGSSPSKRYVLDFPRKTVWSFISWEV